MSQIQIHNLTFAYEGQEEPVFENADVTLDTDWKLGLIGRNGKGKTTFLRILNGELPYQGTITGRIPTDRFPYPLTQADAEKTGSELLPVWKPGAEEWQVLKEMPDLALDAALLYQPIGRLSQGEKSKLMLAVLFAEENAFLLIDEPTNHLDAGARESIREYLAKKKGFLLVSHDRDLLDACTDHVLALERKSLTQESGNFSTWWENKTRRDAFARSENEKHRREIGRLQKTAARVSGWADQSERYKIGYDPVRDNNHPMRDCIGAKTKKLESRAGSVTRRIAENIRQKEGLLDDIEETPALHLALLPAAKERLLLVRNLSLGCRGGKTPVFSHFDLEICRGERILLSGPNGCGKSTFFSYLCMLCGGERNDSLGLREGSMVLAPELRISYLPQSSVFLKGTLDDYIRERGLEKSLFFSVLRELDFARDAFDGRLEDFSEGQKKKVLLAASLLTPAGLFVWDEPMNSLDVFTRMQVEEMIQREKPAMLLAEHDVRFRQNVKAREVVLGSKKDTARERSGAQRRESGS